MNFDLAQIDELLLTTKQVRRRLDFDRPVPRDVLVDCIDIASRAPMGSNRELNNWLIIEDPELKFQIAELYRTSGSAYFGDGADRLRDSVQSRVLNSAMYLAERMHEVPALVLALRKGRVDETSAGDMAGFFGSVLPGVWSFQLALRARGLGSCWTTLHLAYESEAADLLGIPDDVTQVTLLPVGYYTGDSFSVAQRKPAAEITFIDRWGAKVSEQ